VQDANRPSDASHIKESHVKVSDKLHVA